MRQDIAGDVARARTVHATMFPVMRAMARTGGVIFSKAALRLRGVDVGGPRLPLPPATPEQVAAIADDLAEAGVPLVSLDLGSEKRLLDLADRPHIIHPRTPHNPG